MPPKFCDMGRGGVGEVSGRCRVGVREGSGRGRRHRKIMRNNRFYNILQYEGCNLLLRAVKNGMETHGARLSSNIRVGFR